MYWMSLIFQSLSVIRSKIIDDSVWLYVCTCFVLFFFLIIALIIPFLVEDNLDNQTVKYEDQLHKMMERTLNSRIDFF